jgi:hypothetical protein
MVGPKARIASSQRVGEIKDSSFFVLPPEGVKEFSGWKTRFFVEVPHSAFLCAMSFSSSGS